MSPLHIIQWWEGKERSFVDKKCIGMIINGLFTTLKCKIDCGIKQCATTNNGWKECQIYIAAFAKCVIGF